MKEDRIKVEGKSYRSITSAVKKKKKKKKVRKKKKTHCIAAMFVQLSVAVAIESQRY